MDTTKIKEDLKRLGTSVPAAIPYVGSAYSQYLSQLSSKKQRELYEVLLEVMRASNEQLNALKKDLQNIGISNKEQIGRMVKLLAKNIKEEKKRILAQCFVQANDELEFEINKNFLHGFNGPDTDYLQLLSDDLRKLFFKSFNKCKYTSKYNRICITGREGVGKTFNSLLIGKKLEQEGYSVYYCEDVRDANLSKGLISEIMGSFDNRFVFIIDNCQADEIKTSGIVKRTTKARGYAGKPIFIFLSRPLNRDDMKDIFGDETEFLNFRKKYVNFDHLVELFFKMINRSEMLDSFLSSLKQYDFSRALFKHKDMAFWNEFFRSMRDGFEMRKIRLKEEDFYWHAYKFLIKHEQYLMESKSVLAKLLPYFMNGISILRDYARGYLQISDAQIQKLVEQKVISLKWQDWVNENWQNSKAIFIASKIHPTKVRIIAILFEKFENIEIDTVSVITDYAKAYHKNLYYIITPFFGLESLEKLCNNSEFVLIVKKYFKERHLGKRLDRTIKIFSRLDFQLKNKLFNDEVMNILSKKCNDKKFYLNSEEFLFRAVYKVSPLKAYELYMKLDIDAFIEAFNNIPESEGGIHTFRKFMEVFKNLQSFYLFTIDRRFKQELEKNSISDSLKKAFSGKSYTLSSEATVKRLRKNRWKITDGQISYQIRGKKSLNVYLSFSDDKNREALVINTTKKILDGCDKWFIKRFEGSAYLTQLHWLLKELDAMKLPHNTKISLADYFLDKIPPEKIVEWIKNKNTRINELRYIFKAARHKFLKINGITINLYQNYFKDSFNYTDVKKIFDNKRSKLYDIAITSKFGHEILAKCFYQYSREDNFLKKILDENSLYRINESIDLTEANPGLTDMEKNFIISRIIKSCNFGEELLNATIRNARRLGRRVDIVYERKRFLSFKKKYVE